MWTWHSKSQRRHSTASTPPSSQIQCLHIPPSKPQSNPPPPLNLLTPQRHKSNTHRIRHQHRHRPRIPDIQRRHTQIHRARQQIGHQKTTSPCLLNMCRIRDVWNSAACGPDPDPILLPPLRSPASAAEGEKIKTCAEWKRRSCAVLNAPTHRT